MLHTMKMKTIKLQENSNQDDLLKIYQKLESYQI